MTLVIDPVMHGGPEGTPFDDGEEKWDIAGVRTVNIHSGSDQVDSIQV